MRAGVDCWADGPIDKVAAEAQIKDAVMLGSCTLSFCWISATKFFIAALLPCDLKYHTRM